MYWWIQQTLYDELNDFANFNNRLDIADLYRQEDVVYKMKEFVDPSKIVNDDEIVNKVEQLEIQVQKDQIRERIEFEQEFRS